MTTTKTYLAGAGTIAALIGAILIVLALGRGLAASDDMPDVGTPRDPLERVLIGGSKAGSRDGARRDADSRPRGGAGDLVP